MSSTLAALAERARAPSNVGLYVAVALAMAAGYTTQLAWDSLGLGFLALVVLGVSTPTTLDNHHLLPDRLGPVLGRVAVACLASFALFVGLAVLVQSVLAPTESAVVAFVATTLVCTIVAREVD